MLCCAFAFASRWSWSWVMATRTLLLGRPWDQHDSPWTSSTSQGFWLLRPPRWVNLSCCEKLLAQHTSDFAQIMLKEAAFKYDVTSTVDSFCPVCYRSCMMDACMNAWLSFKAASPKLLLYSLQCFGTPDKTQRTTAFAAWWQISMVPFAYLATYFVTCL